MYRLYENTTPPSIRDLCILRFYYPQDLLEPIPRDTEGGQYPLLKNTHSFASPQDPVQVIGKIQEVLHVPPTHPLVLSPDLPPAGPARKRSVVQFEMGRKISGCPFNGMLGSSPAHPSGYLVPPESVP